MAELARRPVVAVTGASGYVGRAFVERYRDRYEIVGLSRSEREVDPNHGPDRWRECDLYNLRQVEEALEGCDAAVYLVHSMSPSARLTQANFADLDLILADNFSRGAAKAGVEHILYVGGLVPEDGSEVSDHLASRKEVEAALAFHGVPATTLRAGLVVGSKGSSFQMLRRLVSRLPVMLCPAWTRTPTNPIALEDLISLLGACIDDPEVHGKTWDIGGPTNTTYVQMIADVARLQGLRRVLIPVRWFSPGLSRLWVSLITGFPRALVSPLVYSLKHRMVPKDRALQAHFGMEGIVWQDAARAALAESDVKAPKLPGTRALRRVAKQDYRAESTVRSVQRLPLPHGADASWVATEYLRWLPDFMRPLLSTQREDDRVDIKFRFMRRPLLTLCFVPDRSTEDRALFRVEGGLLAAGPARGRLEFRVAPNGEELLAAIHEFVPRLPWYLYVVTQALAHLFVMRRFAAHLRRMEPPAKGPLPLAP
ncbi:MAG: NAD-dependent epimerase/dehydratase family protein [Nannocystaceae bacterium]|nr:NAD-dependent epimerase/dehydratase family protein [bacterium]